MNLKVLALSLSVGFSTSQALASKPKAKGPGVFSEEKLLVDTAATRLNWEGGKKFVEDKHTGDIKVKEGELLLAKGNIVGGTFTIDMKSINVTDLSGEGKMKLEGHLKNNDFFDVEKFPTATFVIKEVVPVQGKAAEKGTHVVKGDLTLKGKKAPLEFPAKIEMADGVVKANANITVNRTNHDVKYGSDKFFKGLGDKVIKDEMNFSLNLVSKRG